MARTGFAHLALHHGRATRYLFERMVPLSREIVVFISREFGRDNVLRRLSDPYWFQAFGCVLGFDWHSSSLTTTVCGALKEGLRDVGNELGIFVAGGKGVTEPHTAICCGTTAPTLNLVAAESAKVRAASALLAGQKPELTLDALGHLPSLEMPRRHEVITGDINPKYLSKVLLRTYENAPADFESLLSIEGVGAKTLRALALLIGTSSSGRFHAIV